MIAALLACELTFLSLFVLALAKNVYIHKLKIWTYLLLNLNKVLLILTLFADYRNINTPTIERVQQTLVIMEIVLFIFGVFL